MLKPVDPTVALPQAATATPPLPIDSVRNVFKVLHGCYGNLVFSKFASGDVDQSGEDRGLASAYRVWAHGLREFDAATIKSALGRCMERHPEFPPSLAQFIALCRACKPRNPWKPADRGPVLEMSEELRAQYRAQHLAAAREAAERVLESRKKLTGLDPLKQAIASAVGAAGGDEAAELLRLDRMFASRVSA